MVVSVDTSVCWFYKDVCVERSVIFMNMLYIQKFECIVSGFLKCEFKDAFFLKSFDDAGKIFAYGKRVVYVACIQSWVEVILLLHNFIS